MSEKSILALDPAQRVGWALRDRAGTVTSGVQVFVLGRGESSGMRFLRFRRWLREVLGLECSSESAVDVIAYERPHHRGGHATALALGLVAVIEEEAARSKIELAPIHSATLKKFATGHGNASKEDVIAAMARKWRRYPESLTSDEADALAVLGWTMHEIGVGVRS